MSGFRHITPCGGSLAPLFGLFYGNMSRPLTAAIFTELVNVTGCLVLRFQENFKKELWYYFIKKIKDFLGVELHPGDVLGPVWETDLPFFRGEI